MKACDLHVLKKMSRIAPPFHPPPKVKILQALYPRTCPPVRRLHRSWKSTSHRMHRQSPRSSPPLPSRSPLQLSQCLPRLRSPHHPCYVKLTPRVCLQMHRSFLTPSQANLCHSHTEQLFPVIQVALVHFT